VVRDLGVAPKALKATDNPKKAVLPLPIGPTNPISGEQASTGQVGDVYRSGEAVRLGDVTGETLFNVFVHGPHTAVRTTSAGAGGPTFDLVNFGTETYTAFDLGAVGEGGVRMVNVGGHTLANTYYPLCNAGCSCGDYSSRCAFTVGQPYLVVGPAVPADRRVFMSNVVFSTYTPVGLDLGGGSLTLQQYDCRQDVNRNHQDAGHVLEAAVKTSGQASATLSAAYFDGKFNTAVLLEALDASTQTLACSAVTHALKVSGSVDLSLQPFR
jgi:hypothetical protein